MRNLIKEPHWGTREIGATITPVERFGDVVYGTWRGGAEVAKDTSAALGACGV